MIDFCGLVRKLKYSKDKAFIMYLGNGKMTGVTRKRALGQNSRKPNCLHILNKQYFSNSI